MSSEAGVVRSVFGMHKIKYSVLDNMNIGHVNAFHINLNTILNYVKTHYGNLTNEKDYLYIIVSQILNLTAHYRHYFIKNKMSPDIYIYSSDFNGEFRDIIKLLKIICQYIPRVYFIKTNKISTSSAILYVASKKEYDKNLILTKSKADVLLVNKRIKVLKSNKDKSILYSHDDVFSKFTKNDYTGNVSWKLLPIFYALTGLSGDQIKKYGPAKALKLLNKALDDKCIVNEYYNNAKHFLDDMGDVLDLNDTERRIFIDNYKSANVVAKYLKVSSPIFKEMIDNSIIDKFAKNDLKALNNKYFTGEDSLMLNELLEEIPDNRVIRW